MMSETGKNERPAWCPHSSCAFLRQTQGLICVGALPEPVMHAETPNTHRLCLAEALPSGEVFDLQVNTTDAYHFRRMFDAIDGRGIGTPAPSENAGGEIECPICGEGLSAHTPNASSSPECPRTPEPSKRAGELREKIAEMIYCEHCQSYDRALFGRGAPIPFGQLLTRKRRPILALAERILALSELRALLRERAGGGG